ncbi:MAG TPA: hypothetical protein VFK54_04365 [Candidatus Limnocylindrales bacterium]|nr:hypothetical protein [Candidatus Limnocylindrales bacterium]
MEWNVGLQGIGVVLGMALVFGAAVHVLLARASTAWIGLIAGVAFLVGGLLVSEGLFGWATVEELQPNIDGLSFDEALFGGLIVGALVTFATWWARRGGHRPVTHA